MIAVMGNDWNDGKLLLWSDFVDEVAGHSHLIPKWEP